MSYLKMEFQKYFVVYHMISVKYQNLLEKLAQYVQCGHIMMIYRHLYIPYAPIYSYDKTTGIDQNFHPR